MRPAAMQSVRANSTRILLRVGAQPVRAPTCNLSAQIRPIISASIAVRSLNCVPPSRRSNAAGVISANVAVRSLNRARHSRFSACWALNKIGCSPIVSRTPRRADGRRSRLPVRCSLNKIGYSLLSGRIPHTTAGSRPPLLCTCVCALPVARCSADERRASGAVGVSRPWKTSAIAPALAIHGGLTPAAFGARSMVHEHDWIAVAHRSRYLARRAYGRRC